MPNRANDISNGTIGVRKRNSRRARIRYEFLRKARTSEYSDKDGSNFYSHHVASFQSALPLLSFNFRHVLQHRQYTKSIIVRPPSLGFANAARSCLPILVRIEHKIGV